MANTHCAIMTQSHVYLVIPVNWLSNTENKLVKVFYSLNRNDVPDFNLPMLYFVDKTKRAVYNAYIIRFLSKLTMVFLLIEMRMN